MCRKLAAAGPHLHRPAGARRAGEPDAGACLRHLDNGRLYAFTFAFGAALAGLAGALIVPLYQLSADIGIRFLVQAFLSVMLGGVGTFEGPVLGASAVGVPWRPACHGWCCRCWLTRWCSSSRSHSCGCARRASLPPGGFKNGNRGELAMSGIDRAAMGRLLGGLLSGGVSALGAAGWIAGFAGGWVLRPRWAHAAGPIKMGIATDITGAIAPSGNANWQVAQFAVEQINANRAASWGSRSSSIWKTPRPTRRSRSATSAS